MHLGQRGLAGFEAFPVVEVQARGKFACAMMEMHFLAVAQGTRRRGKAGQLHYPAPGLPHGPHMGDHVAPADVFHGKAMEVQGDAMPGLGLLHALPVVLDTADMAGLAAGQKLHFVPGPGRAGNQRTGDDSAMPFEGEHAVHRQAEEVGTAARLAAALLHDGGAQFFQPLPRHGRDREDGRVFEERPFQEVGHVLAGQLQHLFIHHIHLGERHKAVLHAEQGAYLKVFAGLRHDALVRRDDQQDEVDARGSGHHRAHEALMAGHIHYAHAFAAGQVGMSESQFDGDAAPLLFAEAVAVDAGERSHQRGLAVVDVTGCAHDNGHGNSCIAFSRNGGRIPGEAREGKRKTHRKAGLPPAAQACSGACEAMFSLT